MRVTLEASVAREYTPDGAVLDSGAAFETPILSSEMSTIDVAKLADHPTAQSILQCASPATRVVIKTYNALAHLLKTSYTTFGHATTHKFDPEDAASARVIIMYDHTNGFEFASMRKEDSYFVAFIPCS